MVENLAGKRVEMSTILVTGATGRVGRHVVQGLLEEGATVRALVRNPQTARLPEPVEVVRGDLYDPAAVERAAAGVDAVFLLWPSFSAEGAEAAVAVLALLDPRHIGQKYLLTGPEVLTQTAQVAIFSKVTGKPMRIEEQSPAEARESMLALGADPVLADSSVAYWSSLVTNPEPVTPTVATLLNRPALTYQDWTEEHTDEFLSPVD